MLPVSTFNYLPNEILHTIFSCIEWKENMRSIGIVCIIWNKIATQVAKEQLLSKKKQDLHAKMSPFLRMTQKKIEEVCPIFLTLTQACNDSSDTVQNFFNQLEAGTKTEKHNVSFGSAFTFKFNVSTCLKQLKANASEAEKQKIETSLKELKDFESIVKEKTFATLVDSNIENFLCDQGENITMFPVELFKLKNCNFKLEGDTKTGTHCFFLRGKLMEVTITPSKNPFIHLIQQISYPSFPPSIIYIPSLHLRRTEAVDSNAL